MIRHLESTIAVLALTAACGAASTTNHTEVIPESAKVTAPAVEHYAFTVDSEDDLWLHTGVQATEGDLLVIKASGKIVVFKDPEGNPAEHATPKGWKSDNDCFAKFNPGALVARFGENKPFCTDGSFIVRVGSDHVDELRLKILDGNYTNNEGHFDVSVYRVPKELVPQAAIVERVLKADANEAGVLQGAHREEGKKVLKERSEAETESK
ncbi:MAG: hypothetical protein GY811_08640 [Myxococcales bacterium]|nr:hypothetical protein [Myxococcales bacterium]